MHVQSVGSDIQRPLLITHSAEASWNSVKHVMLYYLSEDMYNSLSSCNCWNKCYILVIYSSQFLITLCHKNVGSVAVVKKWIWLMSMKLTETFVIWLLLCDEILKMCTLLRSILHSLTYTQKSDWIKLASTAYTNSSLLQTVHKFLTFWLGNKYQNHCESAHTAWNETCIFIIQRCVIIKITFMHLFLHLQE